MKLNSDFYLGLAAGGAALVYYLYNGYKEDQNSKNHQKNRRFTLEDLEKYDGDGFKSCFVALDGKIYDVTKQKQRFINAKLNGKCLNEPEDGPGMVKDFIRLGLSREDIVAKFDVVGSLLLMKEFTVEELKKYTGEGDMPAYICAKGMVFDVDKSFYGPDGPYGAFAGKDASRALAKVSLEPADLHNTNLDDLTFNERVTLEEWVAKFEMKYTKVGYLKK